MNSVQIEPKSYEMPPKEGMSIAHFLTVADVERIGSLLRKGFRRSILTIGTQRASVPSAGEYLDDSERIGVRAPIPRP